MIPAVMPGLREMTTKGADIRIDTELGLFYLLSEFCFTKFRLMFYV